MNEEIRRRHLEVEADKRRAQRTGGMVTRDQSITMATAMPTDFDATREDGFKDGLDSRPLPADPYGKDRVPRDKRGKPQDKITSKNSKKKQTIDEARQRVSFFEMKMFYIILREWLIKNFGDRNRLERMQPESNVPRAVMELG